MPIIVTGAAGFIGAAVCQKLLQRGDSVVGIDNHNDYYDPLLKEARLKLFATHPRYTHYRCDIADRDTMAKLFEDVKPRRVVHLAAQAGVRYSIDHPHSYIDSNLVGFGAILEGCRKAKVQHLVFASSSSVYGAHTSLPYSEHEAVDHPLSLYAATKKANEAMAHSYSHLYGLPTTGVRFFTVYGPWGRPDMALFKFTRALLAGEPIDVYNNGQHSRDFTYIDDIVEGVVRILDRPAQANKDWQSDRPDPASSSAPWRIYNLGNNKAVDLMTCINALEIALGRKADIRFLNMQQGDVAHTCADIRSATEAFDYHPQTSITTGINNFVDWYRGVYH